MKNLIENVALRRSLGAIRNTDTAVAGATVDRMGYQRVLGVLNCGVQAGTTNALELQVSDTTTDGDFAVAPTVDLLGGTGSFLIAITNDNKDHVREYIGTKRYLRWKNTGVTTAGDLPVAGFFVLSDKSHAPTTEEAHT